MTGIDPGFSWGFGVFCVLLSIAVARFLLLHASAGQGSFLTIVLEDLNSSLYQIRIFRHEDGVVGRITVTS